MADTVKKSRIVSDDTYSSNFDVLTEDADSLQDIINTEFNERLKNCMTPNLTVLNEPPDLPLTNLPTNGFASKFIENEIATEIKNNTVEALQRPDAAAPIQEIENKEVPSPEADIIDDLTPPFENITITDVDNENLTAKERFLCGGGFSEITADGQNKSTALKLKSADIPQTPETSEISKTEMPENLENLENLDSLQADNAAVSSPEADPHSAENVDSSCSDNELTADVHQIEEINQDIHEFVTENLVEVQAENFQDISQEILRDLAAEKAPAQCGGIGEHADILNTENQQEDCSSDGCECDDSTTVTSESSFVETRTESNTAPEKCLKKKKSKKAKKDSEKENISVKSSFSKFDALSKKTVLHVRSSDAGKAQEKFNGTNQIDTSSCKSCQKQVFQMEQIKAEKAIWHKNCFRCKECNKQLTVDTYQSNEGVLYCKPHFKALFTPKAVEDEPQPTSDKPDLGLEELQNLNVKERFQVFENHETFDNTLERTSSTVNVKRSPSILSKLAKFQQKGMDIGVADDSLNGVPLEESASEPEEDDDELDGTEDPNLIRARRAAAQREIPLHFNNMSEVMSKWESGNQMTKEERREERKQEIQSIRSRLFMGKQGKMKEMYQQAVAESESGANVKKSVLDTELCEGAKSLKDKFERGESLTHDEEQKLRELEEDKGVFETGISKKSRSIFLELDANASKAPHLAPLSPSKSGTEVRRAREHASPERDVYRDPDIIRSDDINEDDSILAKKTHTATKMLNIFRQMEENLQKKDEPQGPKPLKRFTPPPEGEAQRHETESEGEVSDSEEECDEDDVDHEPKVVDEDLIEAQKAARAKHLRAKFEKWEAHEIQREQNNSSVNLAQEIGEGDSQIESARSLRARFESMRETTTSDKERQPRIKVNRFVDQTNSAEICKSCQGRVYPLEKISCHNNIYHKNCFRCKECNAILRMDSYSYNQGLLYCLPHFKRLFAMKGNYESGFGLDQHKEKWNITA